MEKLGRALGILVVLGGCGGGGTCEEDLLVRLSVTDPDGAAISGIEVELLDPAAGPEAPSIACADTGDGVTFECVAPEAGEYKVYALATSFEPYGQQITVEPPEDCDEPALVLEHLQLQRESGV